VALAFNSTLFEIYAFNAGNNTATMYEADDGDFMESLPLPGKPTCAVYDSRTKRFYCGIGDKDEVAVMDAKARKISNTWSIAPGKSPSSLAVDSGRGRLFAACGNNLMIMVDGSSGKVLATAPTGIGPDAIAFDPDAQLVFSSSRDGTVTIAQVEATNTLNVVQTIQAGVGARTLVLDPKTHNLYLLTAKFGALPKNDVNEPRPRIVPGSLKLLVYGRTGSQQ
ncbi:MAG TPA: YncE family protein, partial [Verrucomicrobiae bacterium]